MHTSPTERPFYCITGDLAGEGLLVTVDRRTHELVILEGAEAGTTAVIVNPKGVRVQGARHGGAIGAPRRGETLYALTLHPDGSGTLTVFDGNEVASAELSDAMIEQLIEQLRSRARVHSP